ncbi:MAG: hypothetical protein QOD72_3967 [Acidimicrobiaceae bacterium]|nr:hypothetical protein [Acidimicrobiaceae bacterium]
MHRSAALVLTWREQERRGAIARPVDTQGLGPRSDDDLLLIDSTGHAAGSLLGGTANDEAVIAARLLLDDPAAGYRLLGIDIGFDDATAAGLTCGRNNVVTIRLAPVG